MTKKRLSSLLARLKLLSSSEKKELNILFSLVIKHPIIFDGYCVMKRGYKSKEMFDMNKWVYDNCSNDVCSFNYDYSSVNDSRLFVFKDPEDAMAFKLRWVN